MSTAAPGNLDGDLSASLQGMKVEEVGDHHKYTDEREIDYGEHAPDSGVSVIKVAKELLGSVKKGSDVTGVNLPASVLDPMSSLEKGAKSLQRGELIPVICSMKTPEERFLGIVKFQLAGLPKERFGKKPYNPVLGEVFRCCFKHKDSSVTMLYAEQVSHHPPITALHLHNPTHGFTMNSFMRPEPKYWGNSVEVRLSGLIRISLDKYNETYELVRPQIWTSGLLGIGKQRVEFLGETTIRCEASGLEASFEYKGKGMMGMRGDANVVTGTVKEIASGKTLYEINGIWDQQVKVKDVRTKQESVLFDYEQVKKDYSMKMWVPPKEDLEPNNSLVLWAKCSEAIWAADTPGANEEKKLVEDYQRSLRKKREEMNIVWESAYFDVDGDGYKFKSHLEDRLKAAN
ncbi:Oxysterol-binding protein-like [Porphyridium purpureum]|uniref:Oxysterol-binding protein-like n=1 Tax=Porphyridium purpureum TaxID=35688 RepID=A0A5J4Z598_PORPP|nr:Oxysterol-binding protein-like [Porphyridium purpureum]|eukprot:POR7149..scf295_1